MKIWANRFLKNITEPVRVYRVVPDGAAVSTEEAGGATFRVQSLRFSKLGRMSTAHRKGVRVTVVGLLVFAAALLAVQHLFLPTSSIQPPTSHTQAALPLPDKPSIVVLPFVNMSGDPEQEYFSDGMTEDLITKLSKLSRLFVIARNSAFVYKGKAVKVQEVSREMGVRYILEGSVRKAENQARQMFEKAVALDPQYTEAYVMLGGSYWNGSILQWGESPQAIEWAFALAQQAITLNSSLAYAHTLLGVIYLWRDHEYKRAIVESKLALSLDPKGRNTKTALRRSSAALRDILVVQLERHDTPDGWFREELPTLAVPLPRRLWELRIILAASALGARPIHLSDQLLPYGPGLDSLPGLPCVRPAELLQQCTDGLRL
jgi:hypothetical protein